MLPQKHNTYWKPKLNREHCRHLPTFWFKTNSISLYKLYNIYLNDLFCLAESTTVCNFADDATFCTCGKDLNYLINRLQHHTYLAIGWFENKSMKLN